MKTTPSKEYSDRSYHVKTKKREIAFENNNDSREDFVFTKYDNDLINQITIEQTIYGVSLFLNGELLHSVGTENELGGLAIVACVAEELVSVLRGVGAEGNISIFLLNIILPYENNTNKNTKEDKEESYSTI